LAEKKQALLLIACAVVFLTMGILIGMMLPGRGNEQSEVHPTDIATDIPTNAPTDIPTDAPTDEPTDAPTDEPTDAPTDEPTDAPTDVPTDAPTDIPTDAPTDEPTDAPTDIPTDAPTDISTDAPTDAPTDEPEDVPTSEPMAVVPANPMNHAEGQGTAVSVGYRPLLHADRIRAAMSKEMLPLTGVKIGIDPGHQAKGNSEKEPVAPGSSETKAKVSSGTQGVSTRVPEYVVNLEVSMLLKETLEALGAEVYLTRDTHEIDISNVERATMMNELGVDLVLRIHCNGSSDSSVKGISLFVKPDGEGAEESYAASEALLPAMAEATGARAMGIYKRDTYSGLNWSTVPSILVEMGFMSNPEEDELLNDPEYQRKLADGMARGIAEYMGRDISGE